MGEERTGRGEDLLARWPGATSPMLARMLAGEPYHADDEAIRVAYARARRLMDRFNSAPPEADDERAAVLRELLGAVGPGVEVRPPFRCDYGTNIEIGAGTFVNYDAIMLDVVPIVIGTGCQVASRVQLVTATHPIDPVVRRAGWESGEPITVEDDVWLGAGVVVCPGVRIGAGTVVGAGAVVVRDLPAGVVAVGVPARPVREITDADRVPMPTRPES